MTGMNMDRFHERHDAVVANSGMQYSDIPKMLVTNGAVVRLVGDFASVWEHFVTMPQGSRPYYCEGPESDCPLCAAANSLAVSDDTDLQKLAGEVKSKEKYYFNVLDRSPAGKAWHSSNKKTKLLTQNEKGLNIGSMLFKDIGNVVKMRRQQGQPDDPSGYDIMLSKTGTGMMTRYSAQFTGMVDPLTEEEKAYELWPVDQIAKISMRTELDAVAAFILGNGPAPKATAQAEQPAAQRPNPAAGAARGPVQMAQAARPATTAVAPAAAARPAQQRLGTPTAAPAPAKLPVKVVAKKVEPDLMDTTPVEGADPATHQIVPCSDCGVDMLINMEDIRDLKCHSCGKVYSHPAA